MPLVHHLGALLSIAAGAYCERNAPMVQRNEWLGFPVDDGKECRRPHR